MSSQSMVLKYCHSTLCSNAQRNDVIAVQRLSVACSTPVKGNAAYVGISSVAMQPLWMWRRFRG